MQCAPRGSSSGSRAGVRAATARFGTCPALGITVYVSLDPAIAARLKRNEAGLVAAVAQERGTGDVLMMAWMDDEALARTLATRKATYYSRSRQQYWVKGETSGHTQYVHEVRLDCDGDTVLLIVDQEGAACHTGTHTCWDGDVLLSDPVGQN
ncbi:phosphoribosyl-AMP cyclohydrolase [Nocardia sp. GAS34]